jgi:hypothetical protein
MPYSYDIKKMDERLMQLIKKNLDQSSLKWLEKQRRRYAADLKLTFFNLTFTAIPRFVNKGKIVVTEEERAALQDIRRGLDVSEWANERLIRSWWLLQLPSENEELYVGRIINLFKAAEMKEQVALYGSLPLLAYPQRFVSQAAEGVRTNMEVVFDAVVLHNPFPSEYMENAAWNQLVLKAFFMERPVNEIIGLDERTNHELADILVDYAHERWAAGRPVDPLLWRPVAPFIDEKIFPDIQKLFQSNEDKETKAAVLACSQSNYEPAKKMVNDYEGLTSQIKKRQLTWESLEE